MKKVFQFLVAFTISAVAMGGIRGVEARWSEPELCFQERIQRPAGGKNVPPSGLPRIYQIKTFEQLMRAVSPQQFSKNLATYIDQCKKASNGYMNANLMPDPRYKELSNHYQSLGKHLDELSHFPILVVVNTGRPDQPVLAIPKGLAAKIQDVLNQINDQQSSIYSRTK